MNIRRNLKWSILAVLALPLMTVVGEDSGSSSFSSPDINWIRNEVTHLVESQSAANGEILKNLLTVDSKFITESSVVAARGHFTSNSHEQLLITVPCKAAANANLGWETNIWLLVDKDSSGVYRTISYIRGDIAYQNSIVDMDNDGFDEIAMVNSTYMGGVQHIAHKLYSFKTNSLLYVGESVDRWTMNKESLRKKLHKGDLLYSVLETRYADIDHDGNLEIVEKWIEFRYNGGKSISTIEQRKSATIRTRVLTLKNGVYQ